MCGLYLVSLAIPSVLEDYLLPMNFGMASHWNVMADFGICNRSFGPHHLISKHKLRIIQAVTLFVVHAKSHTNELRIL